MNLILIAPPAGGKGTVSAYLKEKYGFVTISAGELLRDVDPETELGKMIREIQADRGLVNDELMNSLIENRLSKDDVKSGFILDGYPRHMPQVALVEKTLYKLGYKIDYAIVLKVDYELALKRTLGRRLCPICKKSYNELTDVNHPKVSGLCDDCGVELVSRNDDNEEAFKKGFELYHEISEPVVEHYRSKGILIEIDANKEADAIMQEAEEKLGISK